MSANLVITEDKIFRELKETPEIFCIVDDFCKFYDALMAKYTFKAQRGKCSMGWFFGFKLHLICNEKGELINFMITPGDVDDRKPLEYKVFVDLIYGKLVGDKGNISKNLFEKLCVDGIQIIIKLKNIAQVEHSRHRCFDNFKVNLLGALSAYCFFPKKPTIMFDPLYLMN